VVFATSNSYRKRAIRIAPQGPVSLGNGDFLVTYQLSAQV
jgi:hypothetical protein